MRSFIPVTTAVGIVLGFASPLRADVDLPAFHDCIENAVQSNQPASQCVHAAHAVCLGYAPSAQSASATLCFVNAKDAWSAGIKAQLDVLNERAEDTIAAVAGIEVKYDVLANLLQCDRMHELARLTDAAGADVALQKARCEATATGLALAKLTLQARNVP